MDENERAMIIRPEEGQEVKRWFDRLSMYPMKLPQDVRYVLARMAVAYGLDPFLGELMVIPVRDGGLRPYVGLDGMRRTARNSGVYGGRTFVSLSDDERKALGLHPEDVAIKCVVARTDCSQPFDGIGVVGPSHSYKGTAPTFKIVRKRAEHDALRSAFDLHFELFENGDAEPPAEWAEGEVVGADFGGDKREASKTVAEHIGDLFGEEPVPVLSAPPTPPPLAPVARGNGGEQASQQDNQPKRDPASIRTIGELFMAVKADFGKDHKWALQELGVATPQALAEAPAECYKRLAEIHALGIRT